MSMEKRKRILDTVFKNDCHQMAELQNKRLHLEELADEIEEKKEMYSNLEYDFHEMVDEITQERISILKKDKQTLSELLCYTQEELNELEEFKRYTCAQQPIPERINNVVSAYESILACRPARIAYPDHINDEHFYFGRIKDGQSLEMIHARTKFDIEDGVYHSFYRTTVRVKRDGVYYVEYLAEKKLIIDFDIIFTAWNQCLSNHLCKDEISIVVGYLHGDIDFCSTQEKGVCHI